MTWTSLLAHYGYDYPGMHQADPGLALSSHAISMTETWLPLQQL